MYDGNKLRCGKRCLEIFDQDYVADLIAARDVKLFAVVRKGVLVNVTFLKIRERNRSRSAKGLHPNIGGIFAIYQIDEGPAVRRPFRSCPRVRKFVGLQGLEQTTIRAGKDL